MSIHHNKKYENEFVKLMLNKGHHCERIAGSGSGKEAVCDCILFKEDKVFLVEVKATKEKKFYMRTHIKEQLQRMKEIAVKHNVNYMLALKFKRRGWKMFENENILIDYRTDEDL